MVLMSVVFMSLYGLQTDEELAMHTLFHGKHALNYAVHAAAQQSDQVKLASGIHSIDETKAREVAMQYLQANLRLNAANDPLPNTFLRSRVVVELFKIVNDNEVFPYTYVNAGMLLGYAGSAWGDYVHSVGVSADLYGFAADYVDD